MCLIGRDFASVLEPLRVLARLSSRCFRSIEILIYPSFAKGKGVEKKGSGWTSKRTGQYLLLRYKKAGALRASSIPGGMQ
jgi:hypothetical protein